VTANLRTFVDASPDPKELVIVAFIDDDEITFAPVTRERALANLSSVRGREREAERLREKRWPAIGVLFVRDDPKGQIMQTASLIYGSTSAPGGEA
jgi:hypothetical protein